MIVMGIDPGTAIMGYGIIEYINSKHRCLNYGVIRTSKDQTPAERLAVLYKELNDLLVRFKPEAVSIEELFFNQNVTTALSVGQARGIALLCAQQQGLLISEFTPLQVKQAVVGYGRADKKQVQFMIQKLLALDAPPKPDDAADALAVAICHCQFGGSQAWRSSKTPGISWEKWVEAKLKKERGTP